MTLSRTLWLVSLISLASCHEADEHELCDGVSCSGHGRCVVYRVEASCECDDGFRQGTGLTCIPDEVDVGAWLFIDPPGLLDVFPMGSPAAEAGRYDDEERHDVTLTEDFVVSIYEVTLGNFVDVTGYTPQGLDLDASNPTEAARPVAMVSWHEAAAYCNALSDQHEQRLAPCYDCDGIGESLSCRLREAYRTPYECPGYRLPTEAEWEYVVRAGTTTATYAGELSGGNLEACDFNDVLDQVAVFCGNANASFPVGTKDPNDWGEAGGIHDGLGNVAEWCHDWYGEYETPANDPHGPAEGSDRVYRGGSFEDTPRDVRAATRGRAAPDVALPSLGFRPVRTLH